MNFDQKRIAHFLAGVSFLSIGTLQLYSKQILVGRPPLAATAEWYGTVLAWTVSVLLIANGLLAMMRRPNTITSSTTAAFIILYCVLPNLWLFMNGDIGIALTSFGKGCSLSAGLLMLRVTTTTQAETRASQVILHACTYALGFFLAASGFQHFIFAAFVVTLIPSWIPFPEFWTYVAGVLLVASGLCLITRFKRKMALHFSALMIFSWVFIVHAPRAFFIFQNINELTALFEALAFASVLFILYRTDFIEDKLFAGSFRPETTDIKNNT